MSVIGDESSLLMTSKEAVSSTDISPTFRAYDLDGDGFISQEDMTKSLQGISSKHKLGLPDSQIGAMTSAIFKAAHADLQNGSTASTNRLSPTDWTGLTKNVLERNISHLMLPADDESPKTALRQLLNFLRCFRQQIFVLFVFFSLQLLIFGLGIYRYYINLPTSPYPFLAESMISLSFGLVLQVDMGILLLIPAYRWTVGHLRRTFVAKIIPFDSGITFHIIFACTVCFCAFMHVLLMLVALYKESLIPGYIARKLTFTRLISESGLLGYDWLGYTAISGWILVACMTILAFCALPPIRNSCCYDLFYWTHKLQYVIWASLICHTPHFWKFLVGPFALLLLEKIHKYVNAVRWSGTTKIIEVNLLPTNVTQLVIRRPKDFKYNPGDYAFIRVPRLGVLSWHPFTLTSCPEQKDVLWFHIKAVGNWTRELREYFQNKVTADLSVQTGPSLSGRSSAENSSNDSLYKQPIVPTIRRIADLNVSVLLDGPYGASTTALFDTEHAVLIGAGIGVTPFASVLGSVLAQYRRKQSSAEMRINQRRLKLRKLDFIWVSRERENIQWFIDLLEAWEEQQQSLPSNELFMDCKLYITSIPPEKDSKIAGLSLGLDLYRQVHKRDVISGLRTATRTGRPDWPSVFSKIDRNKRGSVRVFYCGPHAMERQLRLLSGQHNFQFAWENF